MPRRRRWARGGAVLAVVTVLDTVGLGLTTNIVTGGTMPAALEPYREWTWTSLGILTVVGVLAAVAAVRSADHVDDEELREPLVRRASNLPHRNPYFAGRGTELEKVRQQLSSRRSVVLVAQARHDSQPDHGPTVLTGMPGVGKTQLANEYAHRYRDDYDIVWWINAERPDRATVDLAKLGDRLMLPSPDSPNSWPAAVLAELQRRTRWLLILDDISQPRDLIARLPQHPAGHVIATSRHRGWGQTATPIEVEVFSVSDARAYLRKRLQGISDGDADHLATALGSLPLALAQAAAYIDECGLTPQVYLSLWDSHPAQMLRRGSADPYPRTVQATIALAQEQVRSRSTAAYQLLCLYAYLAPDGIPDSLVTSSGKHVLPKPLAEVADDDLLWQDTIGLLNSFSLLDRSLDAQTANVHRLVQAIVRDQLAPTKRAQWLTYCSALLGRAIEGADPQAVTAWEPHTRRIAELVQESIAGG